MKSSFLADLTGDYALAFAGQGSAWYESLVRTLSMPQASTRVKSVFEQAEKRLAPLALPLLTAAPEAGARLKQILRTAPQIDGEREPVGGDGGSESSGAKGPGMPAGAEGSLALDTDPAVSVPAILLANFGALLDLAGTSLDLRQTPPTQVVGHSQGLLGAQLARAFVQDDEEQIVQLVVLARLIGAAASQCTRQIGAVADGEHTPMLSLRGLTKEQIQDLEVDEPPQVAVVNGARAYVFSGHPAVLQRLATAAHALEDLLNTELAERKRGGSQAVVTADYLPVGAPFHSHLLDDALEQVFDWLGTLKNSQVSDADFERAKELSEAILTQQSDWPAQLRKCTQAGARYVLDLGPGPMLTRASTALLEGTGARMVDASTSTARTDLDTPGVVVEPAQTWEGYLPKKVTLPDGRVVLDTAFTRLTGRGPIMLPGMTPTTVHPQLVAAAANAGLWTEMAGGGQYSEEVFKRHKDGLIDRLDEGRAAGFNAMFFDRYMWNLQFGVSKIVNKARQNGAPFDSVTIAAGIPEVEEARDLIKELQGDGFTYICFKPGTVGQINQVIDIARDNPQVPLIMQVEDGMAGGHHSWESLDDLLLATYGRTRETKNLVLTVGGGLGTPERAGDYLTGEWSKQYGRPLMPVDAVAIGTAAMATKEARTSPQVKEMLLKTKGIPEGTWVGREQAKGGVASGLSHLDADLYEVENSSARAARLIREVGTDPADIKRRRGELIDALAKTAKPYFGDLQEMTYAQWAQRLTDLAYPYEDWTWSDRVLDVFHRIEARLSEVDSGPVQTLFADEDSIANLPEALERLLERYPSAHTTGVSAKDAAWWPGLCRKHVKPMPFVPALDGDLARWWGTDTLWQSENPRFPADAVRIIPGPVSVAAIDRIDEPIGQMFTRYENAVAERVSGQAPTVFSRRAAAADTVTFLRATTNIQWNGNLVANPAWSMPQATEILEDEAGVSIRVNCDTSWDTGGQAPFHVEHIDIPVTLSPACATGAYPVVDMQRLSVGAYDLLAGAAGVGTTTISGDHIEALPSVEISPDAGRVEVDAAGHARVDSAENVGTGEANRAETNSGTPDFGQVTGGFTFTRELGLAHGAATGGALQAQLADFVPDALVGPCWPSTYAALGTAVKDGIPVIEGLVNAVHLDHTVRLTGRLPHEGTAVVVKSRCASLTEASSGRVVRVENDLYDGQRHFAHLVERFAIRGRVTTSTPPPAAPAVNEDVQVQTTKRSFLRDARVKAPADMTAFANISGDFNPIHTSYAAAGLSGLQAPLVHGMWLSATAQHVISTTSVRSTDSPALPGVVRSSTHTPMRITNWVYEMYGMVNLGDDVEITVERVGRGNGDMFVEATCRVDGAVVSIGRAQIAAPTTAYVYPGQGTQRPLMGMDKPNPIMRDVWTRADKFTREHLGFSIEAIVRENPKAVVVRGERLKHPEGVLNLTQFTQVALVTLAYGQTRSLQADSALVPHSFYAGHSLGEYAALAACARIFPLEQVIEIVYQRGCAMHNLVERDAAGRSNYRMGAFRPNQCGIAHEDVAEYARRIAQESGEFIEVVNFNLRGAQYGVAGTIAGLKALEEDASARAKALGGKRPFMFIPGLDVPFHSSELRTGVPAFREKLMELLPDEIDVDVLVGRYIPNLVARPFEVSKDFAQSILEVVPSTMVQEAVDNWAERSQHPGRLARTLLVELLAWQFTCPVRWIETQDLLLSPDKLAVQRVVEVGLASAPTLSGFAQKTLALPRYANADVEVLNVDRDEDKVLMEQVHTPPAGEGASADAEPENTPGAPASGERANSGTPAAETPGTPTSAEAAKAGNAQDSTASKPASSPASNTVPASSASASGGHAGQASAPASNASGQSSAPVSNGSGQAPDLPVDAAQAVRVLLALSNKITRAQIEDSDTVESLTNGVSSKRNQLLMDMAAELGVPTIEGAAEASIGDLMGVVNTAAGNYKAFGPVLEAAITARLRTLFGAAGLQPTRVGERIRDTWGLPASWEDQVSAQILLNTREGDSVRGGVLASLPTEVDVAADADALIDAAVQEVAQENGVSVSLSTGSAGSDQMVDSAALSQLREELLGSSGVLATQARQLLTRLGVESPGAKPENDDSAAVLETLDRELGTGWLDTVAPAFDPRRAVLLDDRWATAREDLARVFSGQLEAVNTCQFEGGGASLADLANWYARQVPSSKKRLRTLFEEVAKSCCARSMGPFKNEVAVVTGAAPNSIAAQIVAVLLSGGATVVMTASRVSEARLAFAKKLYREHAAIGAKLWLVPANLASFADVDALVEWIGTEQTETVGATTNLIKPALLPSLFFPFAAPPVRGTMGSEPQEAARQMRLLVWSVERAISQLAALGSSTATDHRVHVVLPGSPNRGTFGGDGAYGEAKASFDAIVNKWSAESGWPQRVTIAHPRIGWVMGTSLMGGNDALVPAARAAGVHVFTPQEIADELMELVTPQAREKAKEKPLDRDLTGGLATVPLDLAALARQARQNQGDADSKSPQVPPTISALPSVKTPQMAQRLEWGKPKTKLADQVVIVGLGEVSTWGSRRTRMQAEAGSDLDLTAAGVLEMAWMMDLVHWSNAPTPGWYDADDNPVAEEDIYERYRDEVIARSGIRPLVDDSTIVDGGSDDVATVYLDQDQSFAVESREQAQAYVQADPARTRVSFDEGTWRVTKLAGAAVRVPRRATLSRSVGGQIPTGFDPANWGIPANMLEALDRVAVWNLVTAVDAFISAGFSPAELLQAVHPAEVSSTQGTGIGGMESLRKVFLTRFLGEDRPQDILQEALPNVVAAHVMQSYVGGYGQMIHPVGACATAAVSIEEAVDKIKLGKSAFVVAGGIDDISVESLTGFGDMNATADSQQMYDKGISYRHFSRAGDRRRGGFLEAEGGGTVLVTRGDIAADLGLPVYGVVAHAQSYADGAHTSIPAPGMGALAAGRGGVDSALARSLRGLAVDADDVAVVSKHDTSTNANDPNEAELHSRLCAALGRESGNPLYVISQKTLTGHAKGGAALFQVAGLCEVFVSQQVPANRSLDCLDPQMREFTPLVWLREPLDMGKRPVRASVLTSLGFGHVAALIALVHPSAFEAALAAERGADQADAWRARANARLREGRDRFEAAMCAGTPLYEAPKGRRLPDEDARNVEAAMLLNPSARLGEDGRYPQ
ncbi:type I polyketide synthase [Gleimia hominis]|uniref:type I polyketide synthase n=1 Tax=Gleimia hominis TaxID=595468 RepID=UPI0018EA8C51|nr:type I polyketide synthase [Gleimia hominis]WIK64412.1 DUF1729 domain-containing protein [Gleimia hominis]